MVFNNLIVFIQQIRLFLMKGLQVPDHINQQFQLKMAEVLFLSLLLVCEVS